MAIGQPSLVEKFQPLTFSSNFEGQRTVAYTQDNLARTVEQIRLQAEQLERSFATDQTFLALTEQLQTQSEVRVLVTLRTVFNVEAELAGSVLAQAQRLEINRVRTQFFNNIVGYDPNSIKTYETLPLVALSVNSTGLASLQASSLVLAIEEDLRFKPTMAQSIPLVQADQAWAAGYTGTGQTVAVLDTGVDKNHSMLVGKVVSEACYSTNYTPASASSLCPSGVTSSTASNSALPCASDCEHGTHVAGTSSGNTVTYQSQTLSGVAKGSTVIAIQVFTKFSDSSFCSPYATCVAAYTSDIIAGLNRVYALRNTYSIAAVNLSLGGGAYTTESSCDSSNSATKSAIDLLRSANIATVAASGNESSQSSYGFIGAPACISTAISVGATSDTTTQIASFSNTASFLKLLAPGMTITSAIPNGGYATWQGTSMATPHVAGAWAIIRQAYPSVGVSDILNAFKTTGQMLTDSRNGLSFSRIRILSALQSLSGTQTFPTAPSNLTASAFSVNQINVRWTDNSTNETAFKLERKIGAGGAWSVRATLGADVTVYSDIELSSGTYYYRVTAENSSGASNLSNEASATTLATPLAGTARESLTQNRTYFVSPTGNDSNNGLTSSTPFASIQQAYNIIESSLDLKGYTVMIKASSGTYTTGVSFRNWSGGGQIILDLGGGTISANGTNAISTIGVLGGILIIQNGTLRTTTGGNALSHAAAGTLIIDAGINFGSTAANHINIQSPGAIIVVLSSYTISGGANNHIVANGSGTIFRHISGNVTIDGGGSVVSISGYFAYAGYGGYIYSGASYNLLNGSTVTGIRYVSFLNSIIYSSRGKSHFPGSVDGSTITGGQYQ